MRKSRVMPATEARVNLGAVLRCIGEEDIIIERGGVRVAAIIDIATYERVVAEDERARRLAALTVYKPSAEAVARAVEVLEGPGGLTDEEVDEFTEYVYDGRRYRRSSSSSRVADGD